MFSVLHPYKVGTGSSVVFQSPLFCHILFIRHPERHGIGETAFDWVEGLLVSALPASLFLIT